MRCVGLLFLGASLVIAPNLASAAADLEQARNGTALSPVSPVTWVKGNAGTANSHYSEGQSVPYRLVLSGVSTGFHAVILEWDIKQGGKHAVDYITHYDYLVPHHEYPTHSQGETVDPLSGLAGPFAGPQTYPIPQPASTGSPVPGQPAASFAILADAKKIMTIWNGAISNMYYVSEGDLTAASASTRLAIQFVALEPQVVLAWGGHVGTRFDWGAGASAPEIGGSPYHMRLISFDGSSGNQDRSVQATAMSNLPPCRIEGATTACSGTIERYEIQSEVTYAFSTYTWVLTDNDSGAVIVGPADGRSVTVATGNGGSYTLRAVVSVFGYQSVCTTSVAVSHTTSTPLADQTVCPGMTVTLATTPSGGGPFSFVWRKDGAWVQGADGPALLLANVTESDAGEYSVEVTGACNSVTNRAKVFVHAAPVLTCPPHITSRHLDEVPLPDPSLVGVVSTAGGVVVSHAGDSLVTNGCHVFITRTYRAIDACGNESACRQTIMAGDSTPPVAACPANLTLPCTGSAGAVATFEIATSDECDTNVNVVCTPASGSVFALGVTTVNCVATDDNGNSSACSFTVTVEDRVSPQIICPGNSIISEDPPGSGGAEVTYSNGVATDNCDPMPAVVCDPPSGAILPVGNNVITCRATDVSGNFESCSFSVQVVPRVITATSVADSGPGSLRQAMLDANAAPGTNVIRFDLPGTAPWTIHLLSPLPVIGEDLLIDGWSQISFAGAPVVEVDGTQTNGQPQTAGLVLAASNSVVRGLTLVGFNVGLRLEGTGGHVVLGNVISSNTPGSAGDGIYVASPGNIIGGTALGAANIIGGNLGSGIVLDGPNAVSNVIQGNFIGVLSDGVSPAPNGQHGIRISNGANHNLIGGLGAGERNVIAFNQLAGVALESSAGSGNRIERNSIFGNGSLGIDLGADEVTPNDEADADSGANDYQNFPVVTSCFSAGGVTYIRGVLNSTPDSLFQLDFYSGAEGEARNYFGSTSLTTDNAGQQTFALELPIALSTDQFVTATATDASGNTSEFAQPIRAGSPPQIITHPASTNVLLGTPVVFCVNAIGSEPLTYQWRRNGANIPDATNACLIIPSTDFSHGGTYLVIVGNEFGLVTSDPAVLTFDLSAVPAGDNFANRVLLVRTNGVASSTNSFATSEPFEPNHAGKAGGKSVWYRWVAPGDGIATFRTLGSTFDTLLAVYAGTVLSNLITVASDEDDAGFYTSEVRFNTLEGYEYQIVIDGYDGASGIFVFGWEFDDTNLFLPEFTLQPVSQTVAPGGTATFAVDTFVCIDVHHDDCRHPEKDHHNHHESAEGVTYQWFLNSRPIPGATNDTLVVSDVQENNLGNYVARATFGPLTVESQPASLQINFTEFEVQPVQAVDKFADSLFVPPIRLGESAPGPSGGGVFSVADTVVRGYTGTQVFDTTGSLTEGSERPICGVVGGASTWINCVPERDGVLYLNTDGSSYDTVMAVFVRTSGGLLQLAACDNNSGLDARDSALAIPCQTGQTNHVVVDGVGGATGTLRFNYSLVTPATLTALGHTQNGRFRLRVAGRPNMRFRIERTGAQFANWTEVVTTNSPTSTLDIIDQTSTNVIRRFYRALMLP